MAAPTGPVSLLEAAKWDREDLLTRGVVETIIQESPILETLPFITVMGDSYSNFEEDTLPTVGFRAVNATYTKTYGVDKKNYWGVAIAGGEVEIDNFIVRTRGDLGSVKARQYKQKARAVALTFDRWFFDADGTSDSFKGVNALITEGFGQTLVAGTNGAALTLDMFDQAFDLLRAGTPDAILVNRKQRRAITTLARNYTGYSLIDAGNDAFGRQVMTYNGVPLRIIGDDETGTQILGQDETTGSSNLTASAYFIKYGEEEFVTGLLGAGGSFEVEDFGEQQAVPRHLGRVEFYPGIAILNKYAVVRLSGLL